MLLACSPSFEGRLRGGRLAQPPQLHEIEDRRTHSFKRSAPTPEGATKVFPGRLLPPSSNELASLLFEGRDEE